ncbi:MAG: hypothetical protein HY544_01410 [Candidatus Diapherotrites archaeon]|uniref:Uncharacterized protein n=1 Tax=Candidatus Iainarchaeum sp. TaxID=3101447 RepID=A0A8T3YKD8_9ARCH|nr:hypothetical protein [Candidatus Diapherotrites archaeon]
MRRLAESLRAYYFHILIAALAVLALIFLFGQSIKFMVIVTALVAIASLSTFYQNYIKSPINFELIKFATILTAATYGLVTGLAVAVISTIASKVISEKLDQTAIVSLLGITAVAIAASMFSTWNIVTLGIVLTLSYHLITAPLQMALGGTFAYGAVYVGSNVLFNVLVFSRIAPIVAGVMG